MAGINSRLKWRRLAAAVALGVGAAAGSIACIPNATAQATEVRRYDLKAGSLDEALSQFGLQSGMQILVPPELVAGHWVQAVNAELTDVQLLERLLRGTGLSWEQVNKKTIVIKRASVPNAKPTGRIPDNSDRDLPTDPEIHEMHAVVVTGTHIRGIAPESSPSVTIHREDIERSGHQSTEMLLRSIPQVFGGGANSVSPRQIPDDLESGSNISNGAGVNLRGLGAGSTLTLLNGRRMAPAGSNGSFVDVSAIPVGAIERIEILTDGASSIYGGDAVAGVVNFILRTNYEGGETSIDYGSVTEGSTDQIRIGQTIGTSWHGGNALASYEYFDRGALYSREKKFAETAPDPLTLLPAQRNHSLFGYLGQELGGNMDFSVTGLFTRRDSFKIFDRFVSGQERRMQDTGSESFIVSPSLNWSISDDWAISLSGDYSKVIENLTQENHYASDPSQDSVALIDTNSAQYSLDLIASGPVLELPAAPVRAAVGLSYRREDFEMIRQLSIGRAVRAVFGELHIPLVGKANSRPGIERLELNVSARLDDYNDFGSSLNPKFGALWSPFNGLRFRASYGTSFNPPDLGILGEIDTAVVAYPGNGAETPGQFIPFLALLNSVNPNIGAERSRSYTVGADYDRGGFSASIGYYNVKYSDRIGGLPLPPGLSNTLDIPLFRSQLPAELFVDSPGRDQVMEAIAAAQANGGLYLDVIRLLRGQDADLENMSFIIDMRTGNLAETELEGLDFDLGFNLQTHAGHFSTSLSGSYLLERRSRPSSASPDIPTFNRIFYPVDLRLKGNLNWTSGGWAVASTVNFTDGYQDDRLGFEGPIDSWTTIDLTISYDFGERQGQSILSNARVGVSAINLFDRDPPFVGGDAVGSGAAGFSVSYFDAANANPLGRVVSVRVAKRW